MSSRKQPASPALAAALTTPLGVAGMLLVGASPGGVLVAALGGGVGAYLGQRRTLRRWQRREDG